MRSLPLEEQETSYFAESASIFSFSIKSTKSPERMFVFIVTPLPQNCNPFRLLRGYRALWVITVLRGSVIKALCNKLKAEYGLDLGYRHRK